MYNLIFILHNTTIIIVINKCEERIFILLHKGLLLEINLGIHKICLIRSNTMNDNTGHSYVKRLLEGHTRGQTFVCIVFNRIRPELVKRVNKSW